MALVLTPEAPVAGWLAALDEQIAKTSTFFVERPVVLDLGLLAEDPDALPAAASLPDALHARGIRLVAAENVPADLAGFPPPLSGGRATGDEDIPEPAAAPVFRSLLIETPVRSGTQIVFPDGDVTVMGSIASGAEVMAGGSIHVYGAIRGRAVAGFAGNPAARIMCRKLHAELVAIDGFYLTADDMDATLLGGPAQVLLDGERIAIMALD